MLLTEADQLLYSVDEAAACLQVSRSQMRALIARGDVDVVRMGRRCTRVSKAALNRFIERKEDIARLGG